MSEEATSEQSQTPPVAESSPTPESVASSQAPTTVESLEGERPSPQLAKPPVDQSDAKSEKSDTPTVDAEAQKRIKELMKKKLERKMKYGNLDDFVDLEQIEKE